MIKSELKKTISRKLDQENSTTITGSNKLLFANIFYYSNNINAITTLSM